MSSKIQAALELRKALQILLRTLDVDTQMESILEVPSVFPAYKVGVAYKVTAFFSYRNTDVDDPH